MEEQPTSEAKVKEVEFSQAKLDEAKAKAQSAKVVEVKLMAMPIAVFMALVAMLGAVTAYRAALAEQDTLRFERRLQQGEMLEFVHRQELLSKVASLTRYENLARLHTAAADADQKPPEKPEAPDRRRDALKNLLAEEAAAQVRSLQPFLNYFAVDQPYDLEPSIAMHSAIWLRALGFDTVWDGPAKDGSFPSIWEKLAKDVERGHDKVMNLAEAVVLFVVALAFLTFAQLSRIHPQREKVLAWIGGVLALSGLILAWAFDHGSWKDFLQFTAGFGVLAILSAPFARKFAEKAKEEEKASREKPRDPSDRVEEECIEDEADEPVHPAEVEPSLFAGVRLHFAPVAHEFGRFVISLIAISAVLSALSGFFYSRAAVKSSQAISAALENQAELFRTNSVQATRWDRTVGKVATAENLHLRYEAARQRLELAEEQPALLSVKDAQDQMEARKAALQSFEKKEPAAHKLMTGDLGPEKDVHFPWKMVMSDSYDSAKALARWSANNEMGLGYQREATTFLALLTLFAIALYLLGQALGMGRTSAAYILVVFACALVSAGILRGLYISVADRAINLQPAPAECGQPGHLPKDKLIDLSSEHFARGWVLYQSSPDDPLELAKAAQEFHCAVKIRPNFGAANLYFALATHGANTPQLNEGGYVSLMSKQALHDVSQAEEKASATLTEQGFAPPVVLVGDNGFDTYADGIVRGDRKAVESGKKATLAAIELDKDDPVVRFNLGLAQLAEGKKQEAMETYRQAIAMVNPEKKASAPSGAAIIGGAITDLEVFRRYCEDLNQADYCKQFADTDLPRLKSQMVAAAWPFSEGRTLATSGIKLTDLRLWGSAAHLSWSAHIESVPLNSDGKPQDTVAVLWYAFSPESQWGAWRVLPAISERVNPAFYAHGHPSLLYSVLRASDGRICVAGGRYRAEFYIDGDLAASQEVMLNEETLQPQVFPDLNVALCRPPSWQRWQSGDPDADAVWTRGYMDDSKSHGVFLFTFFDPQLDDDAGTEGKALRRAESILQKEGFAPEASTVHPLDDCNGLRSSTGELMAAFSDSEGSSLEKAWITHEGLGKQELVNVVAVIHKQPNETAANQDLSQSQTRQDCEILLSGTTVRTPQPPAVD